MRKWSLLAACAVMLAACSKSSSDAEQANVSELKGVYIGSSQLFGPSSCLKGEGNQRIHVTINNSKQVSVGYHRWSDLPALIEFPQVTADLVTVKDNVYYFRIKPQTTSQFKVWPEDGKTANGIRYNIAISRGGSIDAMMGYYSLPIPQGEQYFTYNGAKME